MIYHVTQEWDGQDLVSLADRREWSDELAEEITQKWSDCNPWTYYGTDGRYIHCHATLSEAEEFAGEYGGEILEIDTGSEWFDGRVEIGTEYPHPVVRRRIDAGCIRRV